MTNTFNSVLDRMLTLSRALDQTFGSDQPTASLWDTHAAPSRGQFWFPALDAYETETSYVVELDLPGVHPENVDISFEQNTLTVRGTRAPTLQAPEKGELRVYNAERVSGAFARAVRLPEYVEGERIEAHYANGVLTITVPKAQSALPRKIAVKTAGEVKSSTESKRLNA
jgi:HSP20 family protein